ncbi:hypothetical protein EVAR_69676_1 [Eumeta japonica]|uniref:Uncharacterized protein n=1 Tax=Eumeta variegata TaxID=151549 RepID=A0A4C1SHS4_EUMVA|nr:hypothetical protein EVAR_69676_1 [Eumeta japonica]
MLVKITGLRKKNNARYKKHIVKEDRENTILTRGGVILHKDNIKNYTLKHDDNQIPNITRVALPMGANVEIKKLEDSKFLLTKTDDVLLFDEYSYLFHVTNLTKVLSPYRKIVTEEYKPATQELVWIKKIELLAS